MRYFAIGFGWLIVAACVAGIVWVWVRLIRGTLQRRKNREAVRQRVREAREKILADEGFQRTRQTAPLNPIVLREDMRPGLLHYCLLAVLWSLNAFAGSGSTQSTELVFVYIHGFGGEKESPQFCVNMREFLSKTRTPARVENYPWDSVKIDILKAGASWRESEKKADEESLRFAAGIIDKYEQARTPYVLIGFSVGSRVVLGALEARKGKLKALQGVYFLGSAMARDATLSKNVLPAGMKIVNYHSPLRDTVHKTAFSFMSGPPAGGEAGFDDYAVSCTHAYKGVGVHLDYSQLAVPIAYVALFKKGILIPGRLSFNIAGGVGKGDVWWNKVLRVSAELGDKRVPVVIEQSNMKAEYFRALMIKKDGTRERIARGRNLHAILTFLKVDSQTGI